MGVGESGILLRPNVRTAAPPLNWRKLAFIAIVAAALLAGAYQLLAADRAGPRPGHQLQTAYNTLLTTTSGTAAQEAAGLGTFAAAVGRIRFPTADGATAHAVIEDAVTVAADYSNGGATQTSDAAAFNRQVGSLYAELGMPPPG